MKTLKITAIALFATAMMNAQDLRMKEVPSNLKSNFQKTYNNATDVEWEKDNLNYKVEFDVNDMEHEIWYNTQGEVLKSEMEITDKELPNAISKTIKTKYSDYKIDSIEVTERNGEKTYEVELEKNWWSNEMNVVFDANGKILSSVED